MKNIKLYLEMDIKIKTNIPTIKKRLPLQNWINFQKFSKIINKILLNFIRKLLVHSIPPGLNSLTAVTLEDLIKPFYKGQLSDEKATKISK